MKLNIIDHSKSEKIKKNLVGAVAVTCRYPAIEKIYKKNKVLSFLEDVHIFFENPTEKDLQKIKLSAALVYWDVVFILIDNKMNVYADNINDILESLENDFDRLDGLSKTEFILNYTASFFYLFLNIHFSSSKVRASRLIRI